MKPRFTLIAVCLLGLLTALWGMPAFCQAQKPQLVVQTGHGGDINSVAFSPDGRILASGSKDNTIKVWDSATGHLLRTLMGHTGDVNSVAFSPNGRTLASGSDDNTIKIWDIVTGKELFTLRGETLPVNSVAFSPDGKTLASGSWDKTIKLWDTATGKLIRTLTGHTYCVLSIAFSPDGKILASGSQDGSLKLWDALTGKLLHTLTGHTGFVLSVAFSPDGKILASGSGDGDVTIKLWDATTGRELRTLTNADGVRSVAFSPDGKILASDSFHSIKLWDIGTGRLLRALAGHTDDVNSVSFSPDGKTIASGSQDNTIKLWDTATGNELLTLTGHIEEVWSVAFSPDDKTLVSGSGSWGKTLHLLDITTGQMRRIHSNHTNWIFACFSPDEGTLTGPSVDGTLEIWDAATGQELHTLTGHTKEVDSVVFSPNGKILASGSWDHTLKLWDTATGKELRPLAGHTDRVWTVAFSPDGKTLASANEDKTVKLWDIPTGKLHHTLSGHTDPVYSVVFSPDGKTIVSTGVDHTTKLWDAANGRSLHTLAGHTDPANSVVSDSVVFSPDGRTLAIASVDLSGSTDDTLKLWDVATGRELRTLTGHREVIRSMTFSPDGRMFASSSNDDKTLKIWDTFTGQPLRTLTGRTGEFSGVVFSRDDRTLASMSHDNTINLWDVATGQELARLYALGENDWAVVTPEGRFDASPGGLAQMHYVVGLEPIDLNQLKDRYYEPGLLGKLLGFNKEPMRDVQAFDHVDLYPSVKAPDAVSADGRLPLTLTNRGGGIGRVQVFVNGKELLADARGPKPDPAAKTVALTVDVSHAPGLVPGKPNTVRLVTWNAEGYLSSRGTEAVYTPPGRGGIAPPDLWAIIGGISDYAGPTLHLTYPAKDAADFAHALTLAAKNLFGADKVHLTLLDTGGQPGALTPTKANLRQAFEAARKAKPGDIFVVYLAGHGVALPGPTNSAGAHDLYCYLTQDATTGSPATLGADATLRLATTVSSEELTDWIKQIPAQKQVMVLDTCAAGAAAALLTAKRDIPSDQIRAIERLKDRTGFYVLMGCAADAVSYETSQYRQGLLTYSLLKGMKGASLRDGQYVDVSGLFNYAVDAVPQLAQNIGGVQRPFIAAPEAGSFDVGELSAADRQTIPLASAGVLLLRPELVPDDEDLHLEELLIARLRSESAKPRGDGDASAPSFVDATVFPGAIQPRGNYSVSAAQVSVTLKLRRDGKALKTIKVQGRKDDLPRLITHLADAVTQAVIP